ncbi:hypothetical protein XENOCAPTIV_019725, partial [Xenoophorus captivus]
LQPSSKSSSFPVRVENSVPIVPHNQSAQSLQIQPSMLTQAWPTGTQQILIPSSWQQVPGVAIHGSAHQSNVTESPLETIHSGAGVQTGQSWRNVTQARTQQERKKGKNRYGENRNRGVSTASTLRSAMTPPTSSVALSQPIIISDTPSPAISIITIHSDTDTEDERKFHPASVGLSRTNVISCVTVHDSDSSTASPLTPLPRNLNATGCLSSRQAKSLAVVAPSVKNQTSERSAASHGRVEIGTYMKPKRSSNRQPCSSGESMDRAGLVPSQSHPLNLSQVRLCFLCHVCSKLEMAIKSLELLTVIKTG